MACETYSVSIEIPAVVRKTLRETTMDRVHVFFRDSPQPRARLMAVKSRTTVILSAHLVEDVGVGGERETETKRSV